LQRCMNSGRARGAQAPPVEETYAKRGALAGKDALMEKCRSKALRGQVQWGRAVTEISALRTFVVLVQGMEKEAARVLFCRVKMERGRTERETCLRRSKRPGLGTISSPNRQHDQKATMATAPTAQSNGDAESRDSARKDKASMVTGGRLAR
jgi:hypothetical protein